MPWKTLKSASGTGWHEIDEEAGSGWHELLFETALDVGSPCVSSGSSQNGNYTILVNANPCNGNGVLSNLCLWVNYSGTGVKVGTFYLISGTTYKCRDAETLGAVDAGENNVEISLNVQTGDLIGLYTASKYINYVTSTGWFLKAGDCVIVDNESEYSTHGTATPSLYATG